MQAQTNIAPLARPSSQSRPLEIYAIVAMQLFIHALWLLGPLLIDSDDIPVGARFVTAGSTAIALAGIAGLLMNKRWGWWTTLVLTIVNVFLTVPETIGLEGVLRVTSILALACILAMLVLLFRPTVRQSSR